MYTLKNAGTFLRNPLVRNRYLKWFAYKYLVGRPPYISLPGGHKILPASRFNEYHAIATQHPGEQEFVLMNTLLASAGNSVFIDVGANIGTMSVLAHSTGRTSRIVALEPDHRYCAAWHMNMYLNGVADATLVQAAAGEACGEVRFRADPTFPLNGKLDKGDIYSTSMVTQVSVITIDKLCETLNIEHVGLLKIDTEGAEPIVIRGARRCLEEKRIQYILLEFIVEFIEDMNEDPFIFVNTLEGMGFALHAIDRDGKIGKYLDTSTLVDDRRVPADAPLRSFDQINLVAVLQN